MKSWLILGIAAALSVTASGCREYVSGEDAGGARDANGAMDAGSATDAGGAADSGASNDAGPSVLASSTVDWGDEKQEIDGFGGSNAWSTLPSGSTGDTIVKLLFSTSQGAGLSMIRNRIPFREAPQYSDKFVMYAGSDGNPTTTGTSNNGNSGDYYSYVSNDGSKTFSLNWSSWDLSNTRKLYEKVGSLGSDAEVRTVFSTPWTPPNNSVSNWKKGVSDVVNHPEIGGTLDPNHYADYADLLADYALGFEGQMGISLGAVSIQNEPNWVPDSYEGCRWTASNIHDFLAVLKQEFAKKNVPSSIKVMAPEDANFKEDLIASTLDDSAISDVVGIVAVHQYGSGARMLPTTKASGKKLWQTEVSNGGSNDPSINDGLTWAKLIHADLALAEVNAFCYWWLWKSDSAGASPSGSALVNIATDGTLTQNKRLFTLGQFSRFVRPGWHRIGATEKPLNQVYQTAFRDVSANRIAVVLINDSSEEAGLSLQLYNARSFGGLAAYRTSASESLADVGPVDVDGAQCRVILPGRSVTTLYGSVNP